MIPIPPNTRSSRSTNFLWSLTSGRTGLIKNLSPTTKNAMARRSAPSGAALNAISLRTAPARAVTHPCHTSGSKGQILSKVCDARFSPGDSRFSSMKLRCPQCGNAPRPKERAEALHPPQMCQPEPPKTDDRMTGAGIMSREHPVSWEKGLLSPFPCLRRGRVWAAPR